MPYRICRTHAQIFGLYPTIIKAFIITHTQNEDEGKQKGISGKNHYLRYFLVALTHSPLYLFKYKTFINISVFVFL